MKADARIPGLFEAEPSELALAPGALLLRGFAQAQAESLCASIHEIASHAPFRHMVTPGGKPMSVAMTNCGSVGWVTDRRGYRYAACDPESGQAWPPLPAAFADLALRAAAQAGFDAFVPDACLINRYAPGARMTLHQDRDERDLSAPIVSVSLGPSAVFLFGGERRAQRPQRIVLAHGDVVVWGAAARLNFHGVAPLKAADHPLTGVYRLNLTLRRAL